MIQESYNSPFVTKADYQEQTKIMIGGFNDVHKRIDKFEDSVDERFDKVDESLGGIKNDLDLIKKSVIVISKNVSAINQHLGIKDATINA